MINGGRNSKSASIWDTCAPQVIKIIMKQASQRHHTSIKSVHRDSAGETVWTNSAAISDRTAVIIHTYTHILRLYILWHVYKISGDAHTEYKRPACAPFPVSAKPHKLIQIHVPKWGMTSNTTCTRTPEMPTKLRRNEHILTSVPPQCTPGYDLDTWL